MTVFKDEVDAAETHSQSSHEEGEYEDEDYEEDEGMEEDLPFWRQHWLAILVAVLATFASHIYNTSRSGDGSLFPFAEPSVSQHAHLEGFVRTANISFCPLGLSRSSNQRLEGMDFYIPQEYYETLESYFWRNEKGGPPLEDPSLECLKEQHRQPHASGKFKGFTYYYRQPTMEEIYPELATDLVGVGRNPSSSMSRQRKLQQPPLVFTGFAAKFVNLSPKPVLLYWDGKGGDAAAKKLVGEIAPFEALGTATMPGHSFHVTPVFDSSTALQRWVVTADTALVYYEPHQPTEMKALLLTGDAHEDLAAYGKYQMQLVNQAFARDYMISSHRTWLAQFPRPFPMHFLRPADYIGQTHQEGPFTLQVVSVTPRVLVIDGFLSPEECEAVIRTSQEQGLEHSTLHSGATAQQTRDLSTRSSTNTWLPRDTNDLTEIIYERAAQVMGLDPQAFQKFHDSHAHQHSLAESLQVVRYKKGGEEYQPHHDFVYPAVDHPYQPTRFATLLMYLNDVPEGGATRFPRAVNNYNAEGLEIQPKAGKAVLFYNQLEDGNVDDLSQHGSNPTTDHEKWLANLWVWDPIID